jgi:hypothetical protein
MALLQLYHSWNLKFKIYHMQRGAGDRSRQHDTIAFFTLTGGATMSNSYACFVAISEFNAPAGQMKVVCCCSAPLRCKAGARSVPAA